MSLAFGWKVVSDGKVVVGERRRDGRRVPGLDCRDILDVPGEIRLRCQGARLSRLLGDCGVRCTDNRFPVRCGGRGHRGLLGWTADRPACRMNYRARSGEPSRGRRICARSDRRGTRLASGLIAVVVSGDREGHPGWYTLRFRVSLLLSGQTRTPQSWPAGAERKGYSRTSSTATNWPSTMTHRPGTSSP
jgi:hypothetical protein